MSGAPRSRSSCAPERKSSRARDRPPIGAECSRRRGALVRGLAQGRGLLARDRGHARQEVVDDRKLGLAVVADLVGARLADPAQRRLDAGHLVGHDLDDHAPPVGRVGDAPDVARLFEPVDDPGHRTGRQAHQVRQRAGGRRARVDEDLERLDVGLGEAEPDGHRLAEERSLEVDPAQRSQHRVDLIAVHG